MPLEFLGAQQGHAEINEQCRGHYQAGFNFKRHDGASQMISRLHGQRANGNGGQAASEKENEKHRRLLGLIASS